MNTPTVDTTVDTIKAVSFGNGPFSDFASKAYKNAMEMLELSSEKAEKFALQLASDAGAIMKSQKFTLKAGKADKDQLRKFAINAKTGKLPVAPSVSLWLAMEWMQNGFANGVNPKATKWELISSLTEWIENL